MKDVDIYDLKDIRLEKNPRPQQIQLLEFSKKCVLSNKKFIVLDCPPGTGKSVYATMFMDWFKNNYDISSQFDVLTNSKILQEQYTNEFDFMYSLWGKGSYECETYNTDCATGGEWCKIQNKKCEECPYSIAKYKFDNGTVALTNYHLFLTYKIYMPMAWKRSSRVLIIDEADGFENTVCDFITTKISKPLLKRNGFTDEEVAQALDLFGPYPEDITDTDFIDIVSGEFLNIVKSVMNRLSREMEEGSMQAAKLLQSLSNNFLKWDSLATEYHKLPDNWIVEVEKVKKYDKTNKLSDEYYEMTAQPVWAYPYLEEKIWAHYDYVICMSGTILDKNYFAFTNGFDANNSEYLCLDSPFPLENRPIFYFHKTGKQTFKTKEITWLKQKPIIEKILKKHKNQKGIIHVSNYEIQSWVKRDFNIDRILTHTSEDRSLILQQHYNSAEPTVLVSPSMSTGVDLHSDFSRHQTIVKMPFPNLGSKKIKKRMETNKEYYGITTVRDLIQQYGRSIRSIEDSANTYIIDSCFGDVLKWNGKYFPNWFKEAIQYID